MAGEARDDAGALGREESGEQPVILRKAVARGHRARPDRGLMALRQGDDLVPGIVTCDAGTGHDDRGAGAGQRARGLRQQIRVSHDPLADAARHDRHGQPVPVVHRHGDEGRAARRLHRRVVGARDGGRHVLGPRRFAAPLHVGLGELRGLSGEQEGLEGQEPARLLPGNDHQRSLIAEGREDVPERVADTGGRVQADQRGTAGGLRVAVRHPDRHRLLQAEDVAEILRKIPQHRQFGRSGIAEDRRQAKGPQEIEGCRPNRYRAICAHIAILVTKTSRMRVNLIQPGSLAYCQKPPNP